jgi:hypothetical protein
VREINRTLLQTVRTDWDFPTPLRARPGAPTPPEPQNYRERYYGTTDDSDSDDRRGPGDRRSHTIEDMYAFDSPDTVGDEIDQRLQERKRKRRKATEEEMDWNQGLLYYAHRRNAWTGAIANEAPKERPRPDSEIFPQKFNTSSDASPIDTPSSDSASPLPAADALPELSRTEPPRDSRLPNIPFEDLTDVLVPIATPIIQPTHPVRVTISSRSASELYDKVVRDQRTPAVPINLSEMIPIIVQGWKDEGNWPPRASAPESAIAGRKRAAKAIGLRGDGEVKKEGEGILAHHPHLKSGVESMKKVFRLSGHHSGEKDGAALKNPKSVKSSHSRSQSQSQDQNV